MNNNCAVPAVPVLLSNCLTMDFFQVGMPSQSIFCLPHSKCCVLYNAVLLDQASVACGLNHFVVIVVIGCVFVHSISVHNEIKPILLFRLLAG